MLDRWLAYVDQGTRINEIGIPGTHDTASVSGISGGYTEMPMTYTQRLDVLSQLNSGARVLDMRVAYYKRERSESSWFRSGVDAKEEVYMCHGPIVFDITLEDTLAIVKQFLIDHPSEFVALIFQQQGSDTEPDLKLRATQLIRDKILGAFAPNYIFCPNNAGGQWPTVGQVAKKAMILSRLNHDVTTSFFNVRAWGDNSVSDAFDVTGTALKITLQDRYKEVTTATPHTTEQYHSNYGSSSTGNVTTAKLHVFRAMRDVGNDGNMLKINHLSHSLKSSYYRQPYMLGQLSNPMLQLSLNGGDHYRGFLMLDDLNADLCQDIVDSNMNFFRVSGNDKLRGQRARLFADVRKK